MAGQSTSKSICVSSGVNSDLGECFFGGLHKPVIASTDCLTSRDGSFFENARKCIWLLAFVDLSENSFGAIQEGVCVCHGRPAGLHAHVPPFKVEDMHVQPAEGMFFPFY